VSDTKILTYMRESDDPAFTAGELAEQFEMTTEGVRNRLQQLIESGDVFSKKPGKRTVIYWARCDHPHPACSA